MPYGISPLLKNNMKKPDKNLSGKSDEREVKICKNRLFTLHSSFFILWKVSFHTARGKLWRGQSLCFIASNMVFHTTKPYLWRSETLPLANSDFVNRPFTVLNPCNHLSINMLRKASKNGVFSTEWPFRDQYPPFFGVKIRILFDKFPSYTPWKGIERPAQGNTLRNKNGATECNDARGIRQV